MALSTTTWMEDASCKSRGDVFFPAPDENKAARLRREDRARAICCACPVSAACREHGRVNHEHGIWGGETELERVRAGYYVPGFVRRGVAEELVRRSHAGDSSDAERAPLRLTG